MEIKTYSEKETFELGKRIANAVNPGTVILFYGDLGAGKTVMTKGIAAGLGITEMITSPTFTIMQEYEGGRMPLYHLDVYRIEDPDEMEEVGLNEYIYGNGLTVIEWAEQIEDILPEDAIKITIERKVENPEDPEERDIRIEGDLAL